MKYYIIAGERSGDLHASHVMKELKHLDANAQFRFWGGEYMQAHGGEMVAHYKEMSFMGLIDVVLNIDKLYQKIRICKTDILKYNPDALILIDYSGFNMKMAEYVKKNKPSIKTIYYIAPKIWAWNQSRIHSIKKVIDKMFVILPFEKDFYKKLDYEVEYVGNPSVNEVQNFIPNPDFRTINRLSDKPILAVLPGSRKNEVEHMLHYMVSILPAFSDYQFVIAAVTNLDKQYYKAFEREGIVSIVYDQTFDVLYNAKAAVVTSGTATLETALFNVPQVVCFATNYITYAVAKMVIKVKYISLVNLIADKKVVTELIQNDFNPQMLMKELLQITNDNNKIQNIKADYNVIKEILGNENASFRVAKQVYNYINTSNM